MTKKAVVIAGDPRTWDHSIHTARELLADADVYVSVWRQSSYVHKVKPKTLYTHGPLHIDHVYGLLAEYNVKEVRVEDYDPRDWINRGYNANYLHRMRIGVEMVRRSGVKYDSVLFMRPDLFFEQHGMQVLAPSVANVQPGEFVTMLSSELRVEVHKTLNDFLFAVAPEDMDKAIPTVEAFQHFKGMDWHTFLRWWVVEKNKLRVVNIEAPRVVLLRPPAVANMTFEQALLNSEKWDDIYVIHCISLEGVRIACVRWGKHAVLRAIKNLEV